MRFPQRRRGGALTARAYPVPRLRPKRLKPPQPPAVVLKRSAKRWSTIERDEVRYLFDNVDELTAALQEQGIKPDSYHTRTFYLKPNGRCQRRLRRYEGQGLWYLEVKRRKGTMVRKRRRPYYGSIPRNRLNSSYQRRAYEWGQWRLTIDSRLRFRQGQQSLDFPGFVVELKGKATFLKAAAPPAPPAWVDRLLSGHEAPGFGKRKWAELALGL